MHGLHRTRGIVLALCFACFGATAGEPAPAGPGKVPRGYEIFQRVPLQEDVNGITGELQILQDARVIDDYREAWGVSNDPEMALQGDDLDDEDEHFLADIQKKPLKHGKMRLVRKDGKVLAEEEFTVPLGKIEPVSLYSTKTPSFMVWADYGVGMGSYAGPAMHLVEVRGGHLVSVQAITETGEKIAISFSTSLKNGGRIIEAPDGSRKEIQKVQCHPNFDNPKWSDSSEFVVEYSTYRFDGTEWRYATRKEVGYFENQGDNESWPAPSKFP